MRDSDVGHESTAEAVTRLDSEPVSREQESGDIKDSEEAGG